MRTKATPVMYFDFSGTSSVKVAQDYRAKYEAISWLLEANPQLLALAHRDWARLLSTSAQGRAGYTSEQLLRALIVMFIEGDSYRDVVIRIDTSEFLQHFVRLGVRPTMDFTFLNKAFGALSARTLEAMNDAFARYVARKGLISGEKQRMDTTVYETNIHYPTDSSLLWDSFRTVASLARSIQKELPQLNLQHRYHDKKVKKRMTFIARNAASQSKSTQRKVKQHYRKLIQSVRWIHAVQAVSQSAGGVRLFLILMLSCAKYGDFVAGDSLLLFKFGATSNFWVFPLICAILRLFPSCPASQLTRQHQQC